MIIFKKNFVNVSRCWLNFLQAIEETGWEITGEKWENMDKKLPEENDEGIWIRNHARMIREK